MKRLLFILLMLFAITANAQVWQVKIDTMYGTTDLTIVYDVLYGDQLVMDNQFLNRPANQLIRTSIQAALSDAVRKARDAYLRAADWTYISGTTITDNMITWKGYIDTVTAGIGTVNVSLIVLNTVNTPMDTVNVSITNPSEATLFSAKGKILDEITKHERVWRFINTNSSIIGVPWIVN